MDAERGDNIAKLSAGGNMPGGDGGFATHEGDNRPFLYDPSVEESYKYQGNQGIFRYASNNDSGYQYRQEASRAEGFALQGEQGTLDECANNSAEIGKHSHETASNESAGSLRTSKETLTRGEDTFNESANASEGTPKNNEETSVHEDERGQNVQNNESDDTPEGCISFPQPEEQEEEDKIFNYNFSEIRVKNKASEEGQVRETVFESNSRDEESCNDEDEYTIDKRGEEGDTNEESYGNDRSGEIVEGEKDGGTHEEDGNSKQEIYPSSENTQKYGENILPYGLVGSQEDLFRYGKNEKLPRYDNQTPEDLFTYGRNEINLRYGGNVEDTFRYNNQFGNLQFGGSDYFRHRIGEGREEPDEILGMPAGLLECEVHVDEKTEALNFESKPPGTKEHRCLVCDKVFSTKTFLYQHSLSHSDVRNFACEICGKAFKTKSNLTGHMAIHINSKDFPCPICGKLFKTKSKLVQHSVVHSDAREYRCHLCSKVFSRNGGLTKHLLSHSGVRNYKCDICDKLFQTNSDMVKHAIIHSGERNYRCDLCGKMFARNGDLTRHALIHSRDRRAVCQICGKNFSRKDSLAAHVQMIHKITLPSCSDTARGISPLPTMVGGVFGQSFPSFPGLGGGDMLRNQLEDRDSQGSNPLFNMGGEGGASAAAAALFNMGSNNGSPGPATNPLYNMGGHDSSGSGATNTFNMGGNNSASLGANAGFNAGSGANQGFNSSGANRHINIGYNNDSIGGSGVNSFLSFTKSSYLNMGGVGGDRTDQGTSSGAPYYNMVQGSGVTGHVANNPPYNTANVPGLEDGSKSCAINPVYVTIKQEVTDETGPSHIDPEGLLRKNQNAEEGDPSSQVNVGVEGNVPMPPLLDMGPGGANAVVASLFRLRYAYELSKYARLQPGSTTTATTTTTQSSPASVSVPQSSPSVTASSPVPSSSQSYFPLGSPR